MTEHLPALQIAVPLLAAPLCVFIRHPLAVRIWAILVAWTTCAISCKILWEVTGTTEPISYWMGGWAPPWGVELRIDSANAYVMFVVTAVASVVLPFGAGSANLSVPPHRMYLFYAAFLLCITGLLGITITGDAFNVFVFLEVSSLSTYTLIALGRGRQALMAAYSYLIMGTIGGTFILLGIGMMYQMTGSLNMADLAVLLPGVADSRTIVVAFAFLTIGISIKLAVFPLHQWLPNAYTYSPSAVAAFLAATATKVSYYMLARLIFTVFGASFVFGVLHFDAILLPLSLAAMFIGSIAAIYQTNIKRLLAYSSIAQIGYMTLGLSFNNLNGLSGGLVHIFNHGVMKGGLFLVVGCITYRIHSSSIEDMAGLGRRMPITMGAFVIGGLGLIGVPATAGFISKWYLVLGAFETGNWWIALLILFSSLLAVVYVWKVVEVAYFRDPPEGSEPCEAPLSMLIPTFILIGSSLYFGLQTDLTAHLATNAAQALMGGGG